MARASTADPKRSPRPTTSRGSARGRAKGSSGFVKLMKLSVLMVAAGALGFFVVFAVDVTTSSIGKMRFGDATVADLVSKVVDRVLDRDVPRKDDDDDKPARKPVKAAAPVREAKAVAASPPRAPLPAPKPDEYVRHAKPREAVASSDPQVERAKQRLNDLLGRL